MNKLPPGRLVPLGSIYQENNGRNKFYPEGDRHQSRGMRVPRMPRGHNGRSNKPIPAVPQGPQKVHYNRNFKNTVNENPEDSMRKEADDNTSYYKEPNYRGPTSLRNCVIFGCVAIVVIVIILLAVILPIILLTTAAGEISGSIELGRTYITAYADVTSIEYMTFTTEFTFAMDLIFRNLINFTDDFKETKVSSIESGSDGSTIVVSFKLFFNPGVNIDEIYRNVIYGLVEQGTTLAGLSVSALNVVAGKLQITSSCNVFCQNGGVLDIASCTCACPSGTSDARCAS